MCLRPTGLCSKTLPHKNKDTLHINKGYFDYENRRNYVKTIFLCLEKLKPLSIVYKDRSNLG